MPALAFPLAGPLGSGFSFDPGGAGGTPLAILNPTPSSGAAGPSDMLIDPVTLDYVRTDDGEWAETADSRTTMMLMLELELGASPFDPGDGTRIKAAIRAGDPLTPEDVKVEAERAGRVLTQDGVISDLVVTVRDDRDQPLTDAAGRFSPFLQWRDLASGTPIDVAFTPG